MTHYRRILGSEDFQTIEEDLDECYEILETLNENKKQLDEKENHQLDEWIKEYNYYTSVHEANETKPVITEGDGAAQGTVRQRLGSAIKGMKNNIKKSKLVKNIQHSKMGVKTQKKIANVVIDRTTKKANKESGVINKVKGSNIINKMKKKGAEMVINRKAKKYQAQK